MKKIYLTFVLLFVFSSLAFGQMTTKTSMSKGKTTEETIMKIEQEILDLTLKGKPESVEKYYADGYTFISPDAITISKNDLFNAFKSGVLKLESSVNSDMKVKVFENTAVVTFRSMDKGSFNGQSINGTYQWTEIFVKIKGKWLIVATQGTPVMSE